MILLSGGERCDSGWHRCGDSFDRSALVRWNVQLFGFEEEAR
jgi:hypothetical protein